MLQLYERGWPEEETRKIHQITRNPPKGLLVSLEFPVVSCDLGDRFCNRRPHLLGPELVAQVGRMETVIGEVLRMGR